MENQVPKTRIKNFPTVEQYILWKPELKCPECRREFSIAQGKRHRKTEIDETYQFNEPYLLKCGHSLCYKCMYNGCRRGIVECRPCKCSFVLEKLEDPKILLRDSVPINYYLQGVLARQNVQWIRYQDFLQQKKAESTLGKGTLCNECSDVVTNQFCQNCCLFFCESCFNKLHMTTVSFAKHNLVEFGKIDENIIDQLKNTCDLHSETKTFYCDDCNLLICSMCKSSSKHKLHKVDVIDESYEKNRQLLKESLESLENASKLTINMIEKLENVQNVHEKFATSTKYKIHEHYNFLHAKLQLEENELMQKLEKFKIDLCAKTNKFKSGIDTVLIDIQKKMQEVGSFASNSANRQRLPISVIVNDCESLLMQVPEEISYTCEMNPFNFIEQHERKPSTITFNEDYGRFEIKKYLSPSTKTGSLLNSNDSCVSLKLPSLPSTTTEHHSCISDTTSSKVMFPKTSTLPYLLVRPVHFISLAEIYVVAEEKYQEWDLLTQRCKIIGHELPIVKHVDINSIYFVKFNNEWHRGRVISREHTKEYLCHLIDYGERVQLRKSEMRNIPEQFKENQNLLTKCTLFDIISLEDTIELDLFLDFLLIEREATMYVYLEEDDTKYVDFIPTHEPCSIRDTLVKFGYAEYTDIKTTKAFEIINQRIQKKLVSLRSNDPQFHNSLPQDDVFTAKIRHVKSPAEIYLTDMSTYSVIMQLEDEMTRFYKNEVYDIFVPWVNRCCVISWENNFRRGKILKELSDGKYEIQLVDYGNKTTCKYDAIKRLNKRFYGQSTVFCCSLKDVLPNVSENPSVSWPTEACDSLKTLLSKTITGRYQVLVHSAKQKLEITLNRYEGGVIYCINTQLVASGLAVSCGPESEKLPKKTDEALPKTSTMLVKETSYKRYGDVCHMSFIQNPSEFYVTFEKDSVHLVHLHEEIQILMTQSKLRSGSESLRFLDRGYCLVQAVISPTFYPSWYRGRILTKIGDKYRVFLRDNGQTVTVTADKISEITKEIKEYASGIQKCSLAYVKPVGGLEFWPQTAIESFETIAQQFQRLCVKMHGRMEDDGKVPIILYGMKVVIKDPLSTEKHKWTQINEQLIKNGVAERIGTYIEPDYSSNDDDSVKKTIQIFREMVACVEGVELVDREMDIDMKFRTIGAWLPAKPITKTVFTCTPTYVDNNSNIYIQDNERLSDIKFLKTVINEKIQEIGEANFKPLPANVKDVPCLVKFHIDGMYYRGKILRYIKNTGKYEVEFVDYGNTDDLIDEKDICMDVIAFNVPLFVNRVRLVEILPKNGVWQRDTLDIFHGIVVDKICNIIMQDVDDSEISYLNPETVPKDVAWCRLSIYSTNMDVAKYLLEQDLVEPSLVSIDRGVLPLNSNSKKTFSNWFAEDDYNCNKEVAKYLEPSDESDDASTIHNDTKSHEEPYVDDELDMSQSEKLSDTSFHPEETSSRLDKTEEHIPMTIATPDNSKIFPPFDLKHLPEIFFGTVLRVIGPQTLRIQPNIASNRKYKVLNRAFSSMSNVTMTEKLARVTKEEPCLAFCESRQCYGRALVGDVDNIAKRAKIYFVDYLCFETIALDALMECPLEMQKLPVLWINVELTNLRVNESMHQRDIIKKMSHEIKERYVYCVVNRINTADPEDPVGVAIYEDDTCKKLVYENLINENYFYKLYEDD